MLVSESARMRIFIFGIYCRYFEHFLVYSYQVWPDLQSSRQLGMSVLSDVMPQRTTEPRCFYLLSKFL